MNLPAVTNENLFHLNSLVTALQLPRTVLASDDAITYTWNNLPRLLTKIPEQERNELVARMCIAVHSGLFDSAINYIWNAAILALRNKVRSFGLPIIASIKNKDFEEKHLLELQDSELLQLVLELNIIDEQGFFFLSQARATRNNYSAAHPSLQMIDEFELMAFANRCIENALANPINHTGLDIPSFIQTIKNPSFAAIQYNYWLDALKQTYDAQRSLIINMMHGMYCDPNISETIRQNILKLCIDLKQSFSNAIKSKLVNTHTNYLARGEVEKYKASLKFFENLSFLELLSHGELNSLFSRAIERLNQVHNGFDNFYNEPPFAERLNELTKAHAVPLLVQEKFVETVSSCFIGNGYGVSHSALNSYEDMIKNFSPIEISLLLNLVQYETNLLGYRVKNTRNCSERFKKMVQLINPSSVPPSVKHSYDHFIK
ncbi:hypothetical protein [Acinetobacter sp. YH12239]|uniref:hypothetical protein n=1 Tax=Acinetobacter sp. YH12239 TaxID=2601166 RepID=UPI001C553506|nr:hypothetical protein [Acinetobacter sp. YH12239]